MNNSQFEKWVLNTIDKTGFIELSAAERRDHIRILDKLRKDNKIKVARHGTEFTRYEKA